MSDETGRKFGGVCFPNDVRMYFLNDVCGAAGSLTLIHSPRVDARTTSIRHILGTFWVALVALCLTPNRKAYAKRTTKHRFLAFSLSAATDCQSDQITSDLN